MSENTVNLDDDGYPTDTALNTITDWSFDRGWIPLMEFVKSLWWTPEFGWRQLDINDDNNHPVHQYTLVTGGWSGNESIILAMQKNYFFWATAWVQSRRGGHYIFEI